MKHFIKQLLVIIVALIIGLVINQLFFEEYLLIYIEVPQGYLFIYFCMSWLGLALIIYSLSHLILFGYLPILLFIILTMCYWILMIGLLFFKTKHTQGINLDLVSFIRYSLYNHTHIHTYWHK